MKHKIYHPLLLTSAFLLGCQGSSTMVSSSPVVVPTLVVEPTVSSADKSYLLSARPTFTLGAPVEFATFEATITLQPEEEDQVIEGFGASMTESSALVIQGLAPEAHDEVMNQLFAESGIRLSYVRLAMGASDFATSNYSYSDSVDPVLGTDLTLTNFSIARDEEAIIPEIKIAKALNPQLSLMGSPWSAPAWMKSNGSMNGGTIKDQYIDVYAQYFVKFVEAYEAHGITIDSVTMQNEPLYQTAGYPTMEMSANQHIALTIAVGEAFETHEIDSDIIIFDHNWNLASYAHTVMGNSTVRQYAAGAAYHCYGGDYTMQQTFRTMFPTKGLWFTECSGGGWASDFGDNLMWQAKNLFIGSMIYGAKAVMLWNLALDEEGGPKNGGCQNCRGVVTIASNGEVTYNEEYYTLGQFSKFVLPGAVRIGTTVDDTLGGNLSTIAFRNPNGEYVLVILNEGYPSNVRVQLGTSVGTYRAPGRSITTLVIKES